MAGFQSILARTTVAELLKALTPNDYFLIIQVSISTCNDIIIIMYDIIQVGEGQRTQPLGCSSHKTRATPENVLVVMATTCTFPSCTLCLPWDLRCLSGVAMALCLSCRS